MEMYVLGMYGCILYLGERWRSHLQGHQIANLKIEKPEFLAFQASSLRFHALCGFANVPPGTKCNRTFPRRTFCNSRFENSPRNAPWTLRFLPGGTLAKPQGHQIANLKIALQIVAPGRQEQFLTKHRRPRCCNLLAYGDGPR